MSRRDGWVAHLAALPPELDAGYPPPGTQGTEACGDFFKDVFHVGEGFLAVRERQRPPRAVGDVERIVHYVRVRDDGFLATELAEKEHFEEEGDVA